MGTNGGLQRNEEGQPVQSFQGIIKILAVISKNKIQPKLAGAKTFDKTTTPSPIPDILTPWASP